MYVTNPRITNRQDLVDAIAKGRQIQVMYQRMGGVEHHTDPSNGTLAVTLRQGKPVAVTIRDGIVVKVH